MKLILLLALLIVTSFGFGQNILIGNTGNPKEPSIIFDPSNLQYQIVGAILDKVYYSDDYGATWTMDYLFSSYGVWGDPTLDVDTDGNFYFFHLANPPSGSWIDRIVCQKSTDKGVSWSDGTHMGLNGTKAQDKQWSAIDRSNGTIYVTWTQFDDYGSSLPSCTSKIMFSKSIDNGDTWTSAISINDVDGDCIDEDNSVEGAVPCVGPNGEIYVSWAGPNGIVFKRSLDEGATWSSEILVNSMPTGWDMEIPGLDRCNGLPITQCDTSGTATDGTIYINWADQRNGSDDTDIWLAKSTDGGDTWTSEIRVNDDNPGNQQFFTWMDVDQITGDLWFVFYDRRAYSDLNTDVYLAHSADGGSTFNNYPISDAPFIPNDGVFFGDYTNIFAHGGMVRPIWTRMDGNVLSIWTDLTESGNLDIKRKADDSFLSFKQYPVPTNGKGYVYFKLYNASEVSVDLKDQFGRLVHTVLEEQTINKGVHIFEYDAQQLNIAPGIYYTFLKINGQELMRRTIITE